MSITNSAGFRRLRLMVSGAENRQLGARYERLREAHNAEVDLYEAVKQKHTELTAQADALRAAARARDAVADDIALSIRAMDQGQNEIELWLKDLPNDITKMSAPEREFLMLLLRYAPKRRMVATMDAGRLDGSGGGPLPDPRERLATDLKGAAIRGAASRGLPGAMARSIGLTQQDLDGMLESFTTAPAAPQPV